MLAISPDVIRAHTTMPTIIDDNGKPAQVVPELETWTGADLLISPLDMPATTRSLVEAHIANMACLYQIKIGTDFPGSIADRRLWKALGRMLEICPGENRQRWLLMTGFYGYDWDTDLASIDGRPVANTVPGINYSAIRTAKRHWQDRGGCIEHLLRKREIQGFVINRLMELKNYLVNPVKYTHNHNANPTIHDNSPLQRLVKAPEGFEIVMSLDGVGEKLARELLDYAGSPMGAIEAGTDFDTLHSPSKPRGLGRGKIVAIRKQLGIEDGFVVRQVDSEFSDKHGMGASWMRALPEQTEAA